jgi:hypothetical protein
MWTAAAVLGAPWSVARADPSASDAALAEQLYQYGRKQMAEKRYLEACESFRESLRLDTGTGTLLNLAACHETVGKFTSAWVEFRAAADAARREVRPDRVRYAERHLAAIEPRLSYLTLEAAKVENPTWVASLDGKALGAAAWRIPIPVDAGSHEVIVRANDGRQWRSVSSIREGENQTVTVPALFEQAADMAPAAREPAKPANAVGEAAVESGSGRRRLALIFGGAGVGAIGVGAYFGWRAFSLWNDRTRECPLERCTAAGVRHGADADSAATVANWAIGLGVLSAGAAAVILLWPRSGGSSASHAARVPLAIQFDMSGRVVMGGTF